MNNRSCEISGACREPSLEESDRWLYPSDFFELTPGDRYQIKQYAQRLQELHTEYAPVEKVDSSNALSNIESLMRGTGNVIMS